MAAAPPLTALPIAATAGLPVRAGSLERSFLRTMYALVLISTAAGMLANAEWDGAINPLPLAFTFVAIWIAYGRSMAGRPALLGRWIGTLASFAVVALTAVTAFLGGVDLPAVGFAITVILWVKLLQTKTNRDYTQVLLLSVAQLIVASVLTQAIWFGGVVIIYVLLVTWLLLLFHFKREGDGDFLTDPTGRRYKPGEPRYEVVDWRRSRTRDLVTRSLLALLLAMLVLVAIGTTVVFVMMPRMTTGWLNELLPAPPQTHSGLTSTVSLGGGGTIQPDYRRALYATYDERPDFPIRYRAVTQSLYDPVAHRWVPDAQSDEITISGSYGIHASARNAREFRVEIRDRQRPRMVQALPLPGFVVGTSDAAERATSRDGERFVTINLDLHMPAFRDLPIGVSPSTGVVSPRGPGGTQEDIWYSALVERPLPRSHTDRSRLRVPAITFLGANIDAPQTEHDRRAADLKRGLDAWFEQYLPALTRKPAASWTLADARLVEEVFSRPPYEYSLVQPVQRAGEREVDPVLFFLHDACAAHCEYYASALALLLQSRGLNARLVAGFAGGDNWIEAEDGRPVDVVLNANAHAWVEVAAAAEIEAVAVALRGGGAPQRRWHTLDPSPAAGDDPEALGAWELWIEELQYRWSTNVVGFDMGQQLDLLEMLRDAVKSAAKDLQALGKSIVAFLTGADTDEVEGGGLVLAIGTFVVAVPALIALLLLRRLWLRWRVARASSTRHRSQFAPIMELLRVLERAGMARAPAATVQEFLASAGVTSYLTLPERTLVLGAYHRVRFGVPQPASEALPAAHEVGPLIERVRARIVNRSRPDRSSPRSADSPTSA